MNHLRKFNEEKGRISDALQDELRARQVEKDKEEREMKEIKGGPIQDAVHWEIIIENGVPYLKVATDDDYYYVKMMCQKKFDRQK